MESESESNVMLLLENATAEAHKEGCLQSFRGSMWRCHNIGGLQTCNTAAGHMQPVGSWSRGPLLAVISQQ